MITMKEVNKAYMEAFNNWRIEDCADILFKAIKRTSNL